MLAVFIFHFNRPDFLENAVRSVERHLPGVALTIMDDGSTLAAARACLARLAQTHEVLQPDGARASDAWTGGLHANMTRALHLAQRRGLRYAVMLQDDMQIVRPWREQDTAVVRTAFASPESSFVLYGCFFKGQARRSEPLETIAPRLVRRRAPSPDGKRHAAYVDAGIFDVAGFHAWGGTLRLGEKANEAALMDAGRRMPMMADPIMHWLPFPVSFRDRKRTVRERLADSLGGAGVHPISDMTIDNVAALCARPEHAPAYAEDWLQAPTAPAARYWSLRGGRENALARGGWRAALGKRLR